MWYWKARGWALAGSGASRGMGGLMEDRYGGTSVQPSTAGTVAETVAETVVEPDGTIVIRFRAGARLDAARTAEIVDAHIRLAQGEKRPVLADCRGLFSADRASRELAAGPSVVTVTARLAIL